MERISLPVRTVTTRGVIAVPVACALIAVMLLWVAWSLQVFAASAFYLKDFRKVVITGRNIDRRTGPDTIEQWTLFQDVGTMHALFPKAGAAGGLDTLSGEVRYIYAWAYWRDANTANAQGMTVSGGAREERQAIAINMATAAVRCEPMNGFYRQTLAAMLMRAGDAVQARPRIERALENWPPQNAWGRMRAAQYLAGLGADKNRILEHYMSALKLVSSDITSGITEIRNMDKPQEAPRPLGSLVAKTALEGLLKDVGPYSGWSQGAEWRNQSPEVHGLIAAELSAMGNDAAARTELDAVVSTAQERLKAQDSISTRRAFLEIINPLMRPDYSKRFMMGREISLAADVLRRQGRADEAVAMYREQIKRTPFYVPARLALAAMQLDNARTLTGRENDLRLAGRPDEALKAGQAAQAAYQEARDQLEAVLMLDPASEDARSLRPRLPGGTAPTP